MTYDGRHDVTERTLGTMSVFMHRQDHYGMDKYKKPLRHSYRYDWLKMFMEEAADGLKYIQNEMDRREHVKEQLSHAIELKDWDIVKAALDTLSIDGTGK